MSHDPLQRCVPGRIRAEKVAVPFWRRHSSVILALLALGVGAIAPALNGWHAAGAAEASSGQYSEETRQALASHFSGTATPSPTAATTGPTTDSPSPAVPATSSSSSSEELPALSDVTKTNAALPSGGGSISSQAISLPGGPASVTGMGESFTTQLSTGVATFQLPLGLMTARGAAQPQLVLAYNSGGGFGVAGTGWSTGASAITRQTDRGAPGYDDRDAWHPNQDRFLFGGSELVPICTIDAARGCAKTVNDAALISEVMPVFTGLGWQYFRPRIESSYLRYFWSPNHQTWVIQSKEGITMELGVPLDGSNYQGSLQQNPDKPSEVYSWHLARQYDTARVTDGVAEKPVNLVVYRYTSDGNATYLSDIYDTTPVANPADAPLTDYAHHTRLIYDQRPDVVVSYRSGWRQEYRLRLVQVDVSSKPYAGASMPRESVRRYHLDYDAQSHASLLTSVQTEGRCANGAGQITPIQENTSGILPASSCPRLPPVTFSYERVASSEAPLLDSQGFAFEPFANKVTTLANSPPHSLGAALTGLMDINGDGLPDVVVTEPGKYNGTHAWFKNGLAPGANGLRGFGNKLSLPVIPMGGVDAGVLTLSNPNVSPMDMDSDGRIDLVHMPKVRQYSVFSLTGSGTSFSWQGRPITTAASQDVKIDFTRDDADIRQMDVNGDGLVDIVFSSPTEYQTFFALGRFPSGDGQFGYGEWKTATEAQLSTDPVARCAPWSATSIRFSDPDVQIADMNGDGFPDIVRIRSGQLFYWPGRGNGFWGTGDREDCKAGQHAEDRHIVMANAPNYGVADPGALQINDINGDGYADLVEIRNDAVDIYLNDNGRGWTDRFTLTGTPVKPNGANFVQLTDIDGSGTPDILWGEAFNYRYIDLMGGVRPYVLTRVENGLGKTTELAFSTSTELMLQAEAAGTPWSSVAPTVVPVVTKQTVRDNLNLIPGRTEGKYVTQYAYRNPVFEGRQREFRGFSEADQISPGDGTQTHTVTQRSRFMLGECPKDFPTDDVCSPANHWKDNWREALKGMSLSVESFDDAGVYASTQYNQYQLKQLYTGLDGRRVITTYGSANETYTYDTSSFNATTATSFTVPSVTITLAGIFGTESQVVIRRSTPGTAKTRSRVEYDAFGNMQNSIGEGCVEGCPYAGVDEVITKHTDVTQITHPSNWLWRETRSYVIGSINTARRKETTYVYDAQGRPSKVENVLSGTLPLKRFHSSGSAIAPDPVGASGGVAAPVTVLGTQRTYDVFGNLATTKGANGNCSSIAFDAQYAQFAVSDTTNAGTVQANGCGDRTFTTQVSLYDRGMETILQARSVNNQPSKYDYDVFGRLTKITNADPANPGQLATYPSSIIEYYLPANPHATPYVITAVRGQDGANVNISSYVERWSYADGLGRSLGVLLQADRSAGDLGDFVIKGLVDYDSKGQPIRTYEEAFYAGLASAFQPSAPSNIPSYPASAGPPVVPAGPPLKYSRVEYDNFGRKIRSYDRAGSLKIQMVVHAQSIDAWDAADLQAGPASGTYTTAISDGHGRAVSSIERANVNSAIEQHVSSIEYLPTGEPVQVTQSRAGSPSVTRWMRYDSLGRMVLNVEPNTSPNFNASRTVDPTNINAWRYAYNDSGQMVGTSDARGCGVNYHYDAGGRLLAEDYSPCASTQAAYTAPNLTTGDGTEAFFRYDYADPEAAGMSCGDGTLVAAFTPDANMFYGHLVSAADRGSKTFASYNAVGQAPQVAVKMARPGAPSSTLSTRYEARCYLKAATYDAAGRVLTTTTGAPVPELTVSNQSTLQFQYAKNGAVQSVGGSYGTLFAGAVYAADGAINKFTLGDAAATTRNYEYDSLRRLSKVYTQRAAAQLWTNPPQGSTYTIPGAATTQMLLEDYELFYDGVGNVTQITDWRTPSEWPDSARPSTRKFEYDTLYRLTKATYEYTGTATPTTPDTWKSPYDNENTTPNPNDPKPSPHVSFPNRVTQQTYSYDFLGNSSVSTDDSSAFYDRSLGTITNGTATAGPAQLKLASNRTLAPTSPRKGDLDAKYDDAGNVTDIIIRRDGPCLPTGASCWQRFQYTWDEIGNLKNAKRWDLKTTPTNERTTNGLLSQPVPPRNADVTLDYTYSGQSRTVKTATDPAGAQRHSVYIFSSFELRRTTWDGAINKYALTPDTASVRLEAGPATARVVYSNQSLPTLTSGQRHVLLELSDRLGSGTFVIEHATGELVNYSTYMAYGGIESDYRPARWGSFREPYKFSGKEEDIEVGLAYFGARYYSTALGRWMSPDAVTIHALGSDPNPYAYVHGSPIMGVDPDGNEPISLTIIVVGIVIGAVVAGGANAVQQYYTGGKSFDHFNWGSFGGAVAGGAIGGAFAGPVGGIGNGWLAAGASIGVGAVAGGGGYLLQQGINHEKVDGKGLGIAAGMGAAGGLAGFGIGKGVSFLAGKFGGQPGGASTAAGGLAESGDGATNTATSSALNDNPASAWNDNPTLDSVNKEADEILARGEASAAESAEKTVAKAPVGPKAILTPEQGPIAPKTVEPRPQDAMGPYEAAEFCGAPGSGRCGGAAPIFRGGASLRARLGVDVKEGADGLVSPVGSNGKPQGISLNLDPKNKFIQQYGGAFPVESVPEGLQVVQSGGAGHFVIGPSKPMSFGAYQDLLDQVKLGSFNRVP